MSDRPEQENEESEEEYYLYPISIDDGKESMDPNEPVEVTIEFNYKEVLWRRSP